jgi:hypothetical protein
MSTATDQMQNEFQKKATEAFFSVFSSFEKAGSKLNRNAEEYRFQLMKKQYIAWLDHELQSVAKDVLQSHQQEKQSREVDQLFHQNIRDYLHRFVQQANAL